MIKFDVILFFLGIVGVIVGAALVEYPAGAFLFTTGCLLFIGAPLVTVADRQHRRGGRT